MALVRAFLVFLILGLFLAACGSPDARPPGSYFPTAEPTVTAAPTSDPKVTRGTAQDEDDIEDDIKETLLRNQFDKSGDDPANPYKAYCLGSGTTFGGLNGLSDPSQSLLDRFKGNMPPVVKASDCVMVGDLKAFTGKTVLKTTSEPVRFYAVSAVTWLGTNRVELEISHQGDQGDSGGQVFQLEKKEGNWQVVGFTRTWVA